MNTLSSDSESYWWTFFSFFVYFNLVGILTFSVKVLIHNVQKMMQHGDQWHQQTTYRSEFNDILQVGVSAISKQYARR